MRKFIIVTLVASSLATVLFVALRDKPFALENTSANREVQSTATQRAPTKTLNLLSGNSEFDAQISDEEVIAVGWREHPSRSIVHPTGSPMENYLYYRQLAEAGNGVAAHQLANMMLGCASSRGEFQNRAQLDAAVSQMREASAYTPPGSENVVLLNEPHNVELFVDVTTKAFEKCKNFTEDQIQETERWLEISAINGYSVGMLDYANRLKDPNLKRGLYQDAWLQGDAQALLALASYLQESYDSGVDPSAKFPAFVAMHAFVTLRSARYDASSDSVVGRITLEYQSDLEKLARQMFPEELEAAVVQSRDLIRSNPNCCY